MKLKLQKALNVVVSLSLLVNSISAPLSIYAQEITPSPEPTPIVEESSSPEPTIIPSEEPISTPTETPIPSEEPVLSPIPSDLPVETQSPEPDKNTNVEENQNTESSSSTEPTPTVTPAEPQENGHISAIILENTQATSIDEFDLEYQNEGSATIQTDKLDYAPTDTVLVTGSGFLPNTEYGIEITSDTGNFKFTDRVSSDEAGGLFYSYQLDGTYRPNYSVEIKDGEKMVASTTFTDTDTAKNAGTGADGGGTGSSWTNPGYITADDTNYATSTISASANSHYLFGTNYGFAIPAGSTINGITVVIARSGGSNSINDNVVQMLKGGALTGNDKGTSTNWPTSIGTATYGNSADKWGTTWTVDEINASNFGVALSGHNQSSQNTRTASVDYMQITVSYTEPPTTGTIVIVKDAVQNNAQDFVFTNNFANGNPATFSLDDDSDGTLPSTRSFIVLPGTYSVSEAFVNGWTSNGGVCSDGSLVNAVQVSIGETVTCTFTNTQDLPDLTAVKTNNVGGNATINQPFIWTIRVQNLGSATASFSNNQNVLWDERQSTGVSSYGTPTITTSGTSGSFDCSQSGTISRDLLCEANGVATMPVGSYIDISYTVTPNITGILDNPRSSQSCEVDDGEAVTESNEGNNDCSDSVNVAPDTGVDNPDLPQACGLDIAMILDNSGSISSSELAQMKSAMTAFTSALSGTPTQFSVTHFATTATVDQGFTSDITDVNTAINGIPVDGGYTNWEDGFLKGQSTFDPRSNPNLVIFASDGNPNTVDNGPANNASESQAVSEAKLIADALKTSGARILAIGIGSDLDTANMQIVSGPSVNTGDVLTSDVITTDFTGLAAQLAIFVSQTCGGTITVHKVVTGEQSPTLSGWHFTVNGQDYVTDGQGFTQAIPVTPGTYSVVEITQGSYTLTDKSCTLNNQSTGSPITNGVGNITIGANDVVSCTFTNNFVPQTGTIELKKVWVGTGGQTTLRIGTSVDGSEVDTQLTGTAGASPLTTGQNTVNIGTYYTTETGGLTNYTYTGESCFNDVNNNGVNDNEPNVPTGSHASVVVGSGQHVICTLTNTRNTGSVKINKLVDTNANGTFETINPLAFTWSLDGSGTNAMGGTVSGVNTGSHNVNENSVSGYHFVAWYPTGDQVLNCNNIPEATIYKSLPININVNTGDTVDITICNSRDTGNLKVQKIVDYGSLNDWWFSLDGGTAVQAGVNGIVDFGQVTTLDNHTISESGPNTFYLDSISGINCSTSAVAGIANATVSSGGVTTCTFTNNVNKGSITIIKDANPNDSQDFSFTAQGSNVSGFNLDDDSDLSLSNTKVFSNLFPGAYTISEVTPVTGWDLTSLTCVSDIVGKTVGPFVGTNIASFSLVAGEDVTCTFTNTKRGSVSGYKWEDVNGNGIEDAGEPRLEGWEIGYHKYDALHNSWVSNVPDDDFTDANGEYSFSNLEPGDYYVTEYMKLGWNLKFPTSGKHYFTIHPGDNLTGYKFGNFELGSISGQKFNDLDKDGVQDDNEPGLEGWTIYIDKNNNNILDAGDISTLTDIDGNYTFNNLTVGNYLEYTYAVKEVIKPGWMETYPVGNVHYITVLSGTNATGIDFGNFEYGTVNVNKYEDTDGILGRTDGQEFWIGDPTFTFRLYKVTDDAWSFVGQSDTDENGLATFDHMLISLGDYRICEVKKDGWEDMRSLHNPANNESDNAVNEYSVCEGITFSTSGYRVYTEFGNIHYGGIEGHKVNDLNGNGDWDNEEPVVNHTDVLGGVVIFIDSNDNQILDNEERSTNTDNDGYYKFDNLLIGEYDVCEVLPQGWVNTFPSDSNCHSISVTPGRTVGYDFGNIKIELNLDLTKSNVVDGSKVTYTLVVTNTGNQDLNTVKITDALPGGFSYVSGSSKVDGISVSDPSVVGGALVWEIDGLLKGSENSKTLTYEANIASDLKNGTYTNIAYALGTFRYGREFSESSESKISTSNVVVSLGIAFSGTLTPQVLGASTELPATGNPTIMLVILVLMGLIGISLKIYERKGKNAKN